MSLFFIASKVLKIFLIPLWQFVLLVAAGQLASWIKWRRLSRFFIGTAFMLFLLYSFIPFGQTLLRPLENYAPAPSQEMLARAEGIIVLGGFTGSGIISADRQAPQLSGLPSDLSPRWDYIKNTPISQYILPVFPENYARKAGLRMRS